MRRISGWDVAFYLVIVAVIFSLVRPGSKAGKALIAAGSALTAVIGLATGYVQRG